MADLTLGGKTRGHVIGIFGSFEILRVALGAFCRRTAKPTRTMTLKAVEGSMPTFEPQTGDGLVVPGSRDELVPGLRRVAVAAVRP
jgi:hypothetical protein